MINHKESNLPEKELELDSEILCLFPGLDFKRARGRTKGFLQTCLKVLRKTAIEPYYVTEYSLKREGIGAQSALNALTFLVELGLLKCRNTTNKKGTKKSEKTMTSKGIIACLAICDFQKTEKVRELLSRDSLRSDKLAGLLRIYNEGYSQRKIPIKKTDLTPIITILKEYSIQKYNLDQKSEESIINDLRRIEEEQFVERNKILTPFFDAGKFFPKWLTLEIQERKKVKIILQNYIKLLEETEMLPASEMERVAELSQNFFLTFSSPEFIAWASSSKAKSQSLEHLNKNIDNCLHDSIESSDPLTRLEILLKILREGVQASQEIGP